MISGIGALNPQGAIGSQTGIGQSNGVADLFSDGLSPAAGAEAGGSFAAMLTQAATRTVGTLQNAEQVSVQALQGNADMRQVADAVMSAEQSLHAAVAIRDKIVTAYLEVGRMAI